MGTSLRLRRTVSLKSSMLPKPLMFEHFLKINLRSLCALRLENRVNKQRSQDISAQSGELGWGSDKQNHKLCDQGDRKVKTNLRLCVLSECNAFQIISVCGNKRPFARIKGATANFYNNQAQQGSGKSILAMYVDSRKASVF